MGTHVQYRCAWVRACMLATRDVATSMMYPWIRWVGGSCRETGSPSGPRGGHRVVRRRGQSAAANVAPRSRWQPTHRRLGRARCTASAWLSAAASSVSIGGRPRQGHATARPSRKQPVGPALATSKAAWPELVRHAPQARGHLAPAVLIPCCSCGGRASRRRALVRGPRDAPRAVSRPASGHYV